VEILSGGDQGECEDKRTLEGQNGEIVMGKAEEKEEYSAKFYEKSSFVFISFCVNYFIL
jgi:hypothetical protein